MKSGIGAFARDVFEILITALVIALVIRTFVVEVTRVPTESMVPTIQAGDRLLTDKILFRVTGIRHGDIVVFTPPFASADPYVKRVIGLPGDRINVRGGTVYRNGEALKEPYLSQKPSYRKAEVVVPEGKMLVLGDNRNASNDSHAWEGNDPEAWGFADLSKIKGRAFLRLWPGSRFGRLAH